MRAGVMLAFFPLIFLLNLFNDTFSELVAFFSKYTRLENKSVCMKKL